MMREKKGVNKSKLKPCPFCGVNLDHRIDGYGEYYVHPDNGCVFWSDRLEDDKDCADWNRRVNDDA